VVPHDTQDVRGKRRIHAVCGGVCVGVAGLWVGGRILGKFVIHINLMATALISAGNITTKVVRYGMIIGLGSVLEAVSGQNDNIILPVYVWSMLAMGLFE
jgi:hypothetical protein